ncbi:MAG: iron-containing alcohol dehydrogenase [Candidatus Aminicenantes bacterium]|nr:iron-containing alcohol dehydrogenase [Candidatus Aminicenantes bacterium]
MLNFNYLIPTEILFGKEQISNLESKIEDYNRILFAWGGGSIKKNGIYEKVIDSLKNKTYFELSGIKPNPRLSSVKKGIRICTEDDVDFILAVGGGSVIDCSKAIAAGVYYPDDVWDLFMRKATVEKALPIGTILTLAATASEINASAVINNEETQQKLSITSNLLRPKFSILDPTYTMTVPRAHTAAGVVDIMSHVFEQYFDTTKGTYLQDRLAEGILKTCIKYGPIVLENPDDYEARANVMWAGSLALSGLLSFGKKGDFATHKIEHEVSAIYDLTHGIGMAILFPNWMKYVMHENIDKFVEFAHNVWDIPNMGEKKDIANLGIQKTREFFSSLDMPTTFFQVNISYEKYEEMATKAVYFGEIGSFKKLKKEDVLEILKLSL